MIVIIDYGAGNIGSVNNAIAKLGYRAVITSKPDDVLNASTVILPGVGSAGDTMNSLQSLGMVEAIKETIAMKRPLFAICVGLQVLMTFTEEGGLHQCMDIFQGGVKHLPPGQKIPHMGWNQVKQQFDHPIFNGIPDKTNFYFVHSYYVDPVDEAIVAGETEYDVVFTSAIACDNVFAVQFHPEKSAADGLQLLKNFTGWDGN